MEEFDQISVGEVFYPQLKEQLKALCEGVRSPVSILANAAALLYGALDQVNWLGFYLLEGDMLLLGPFQGKPACIEIPVGRGVCGTAVARDCTQRVEDVHRFSGHIVCDSASRSELVIPLHGEHGTLGVMDIDSPLPGRFSAVDQAGMEEIAHMLESILSATGRC